MKLKKSKLENQITYFMDIHYADVYGTMYKYAIQQQVRDQTRQF